MILKIILISTFIISTVLMYCIIVGGNINKSDKERNKEDQEQMRYNKTNRKKNRTNGGTKSGKSLYK